MFDLNMHVIFISQITTNRSALSEDYFSLIQRFVILMYDRSSPVTDVTTCRRQLFTSSNTAVEHLPSTCDNLKQHVLRAMLQKM